MKNTRLVSQDESDDNQQTSTSTQGRVPSTVATRPDQAPTTMAQTSNDGMSLVRARLRQQNISKRACDIIMEPWKSGTTKQYRVYLDKWRNFGTERSENPIHPSVASVTDFLRQLHDTGSSYSAINTARSALSAAVKLTDSKLHSG